MGGLRTRLPLAFWTFLVGGASLAGFPFVTAGFYSKDRILAQAWLSGGVGHWLWAAGWVGALLTALYIFRVVFIVFFGESGAPVEKRPGNSIRIPLIILAVLALTAGLLGEPRLFGGADPLSRFLAGALPVVAETSGEAGAERILQALAAAASLGGILLAYVLFLPGRRLVDALTRARLGGALHRCWFQGWGFDWLYDRLLIRPFVWVARANRQDVLDLPFRGVARLSVWCYGVLRGSQTGQLRWYATAIVAGSVAIVAIVLLR